MLASGLDVDEECMGLVFLQVIRAGCRREPSILSIAKARVGESPALG